MAVKTYQVREPIKHDGKRHTGGTIELEEKLAAPHVASGVLGEIAAAPVFKVHSGPADEAERRAEIKAAIAQLDPNNAELWMRNGAPTTEAIQAITGWPVAAADRNAVWGKPKAKA